MVRQGAIDSPPKCPFILGFECAGEIEQVGEGVEGLAVSLIIYFIANVPIRTLCHPTVPTVAENRYFRTKKKQLCGDRGRVVNFERVETSLKFNSEIGWL